MSRIFVGNTDGHWFDFLARRGDLEAVNFWQPGGNRRFGALKPGELFLFRLKSPIHRIAGGGWFETAQILPISVAWQVFEEGNGVPSPDSLVAAVERYRGRSVESPHLDQIGCISLGAPFFLEPEDWLPVPPDWPMNAVGGKTYDVDDPAGRRLMDAVLERMPSAGEPMRDERGVYRVDGGRVPTVAMRRTGQQAFKVLVLEAYDRRCAVTGGKVLPVLEAAHIRPFAQGGEHDIANGLLLRSDVHALFDLGYLTITPELTVRASHRLKDDFDNGNDYRRLDGHVIHTPRSRRQRPDRRLLEWHADTVFKR